MTDAADFFRSRLDQMIDLRHSLAILASRMPWQELEASVASVLANRVRSGKKIEGSDLFGPVSGIANPGSSGGRPRISLRLMISRARTRRPKKRGAEQGSSTPKIYSWHAPEVACINKGKARTPYEFGAKVSIATSVQGNLIVGARAFGGNPLDGHTLAEQLERGWFWRLHSVADQLES